VRHLLVFCGSFYRLVAWLHFGLGYCSDKRGGKEEVTETEDLLYKIQRLEQLQDLELDWYVCTIWEMMRQEIEDRLDKGVVEQSISPSPWEKDWKEGERIIFDGTNR